MDGIKHEHFDWPAGHNMNNMVELNVPSRASPIRNVMLAALLVCMCTPIVGSQRHHHPRLWPPANIEPCAIQCPAQHVQMAGNKSSGDETSHWGAQPILDFMYNSHLQTSAPSLQPLTLPANVVAASGITTLMTSVTGPPRSRETSFPRSTVSMVVDSGGRRTFECKVIYHVITTLGCMWIARFHNM